MSHRLFRGPNFQLLSDEDLLLGLMLRPASECNAAKVHTVNSMIVRIPPRHVWGGATGMG